MREVARFRPTDRRNAEAAARFPTANEYPRQASIINVKFVSIVNWRMTLMFKDFIEDTHANLYGKGLLHGLLGLFYNPGLLAVSLYRVSSFLSKRGSLGKFLALIIWRLNVAMNGVYLHWECVIGPGLFLPHPIGVVVGAGARIGRNVTLYQNTTIGMNTKTIMEPIPLSRMIL